MISVHHGFMLNADFSLEEKAAERELAKSAFMKNIPADVPPCAV